MQLSVANLTVERVPFELEDGTEIYFRSMKDFNYLEKAEWTDIRKRFERANKQRDKASTENMGVAKQAEIEKRYRGAYIDMITLCLPDLPKTVITVPDGIEDQERELAESKGEEYIPRWRGLTHGQIDEISGYCLRVASGRYVTDEALALVRKAYPTLSEPFVQSISPEQAVILINHGETFEDKENQKNN